MKKINFVAFAVFSVLCISLVGMVNSAQRESNISETQDAFRDYWYNGEAEISSYTLEQARYGEMHSGTASLVFVTEDIDNRTLVKNDASSTNKTPALKLNFTKKFITGIYPYSMMMSVFAPVNQNRVQPAMKVSTASQEWCGHTYLHLKRKDKGYAATMHSYFPNEGDEEKFIYADLTEDQLWTQIRINPELLPEGEVMMIPSTFYSRLKHVDLAPQKATIKRSARENGDQVISIAYSNSARTLRIFYKPDFPYVITGWEESYSSGWGASKKPLVTKARLNKTILLDYWNRNSPEDEVYRKQLGLD